MAYCVKEALMPLHNVGIRATLCCCYRLKWLDFYPSYNKKLSIVRGKHLSVGLPGFEPRKTGPESVVLPLHHSPNSDGKVKH